MTLAAIAAEVPSQPVAEHAPVAGSTVRVPELDGLRGLMTLFVIVSHYFGEVPGGLKPFCVGWVAVHVFFVLSGYLVGRLIIEKKHAANFLAVFYLRRICRTFPSYFLCCSLILAGTAVVGANAWAEDITPLPAWSYFVFLQNLFTILEQSTGVRWLAPTWTLALEEQFYLVAPVLFLMVPRRLWVPVLITISLGGFLGRLYGVTQGLIAVAPLSLLPASADVLCAGLLLAVLVERDVIPWQRWGLVLRVAPVVCLFATFAVQRIDTEPGGPWFQVLGPLLVAAASACFILMLVKGAPEAKRFRSPVLRFFGEISYGLYLTHLAVLGLLHGLLFGTPPDLASWRSIVATLAAVPVTIAVAWLLTTVVERPVMAWGRRFPWR